MKRMLLVLLVALAVPAPAQAKEITGLELCGSDGCATSAVSGFGHADPLASHGFAAPGPTAFHRLELVLDDGLGGWPVYYEPRSGLVAFREGNTNFFTWGRLDARLAPLVKELARRVMPYPTPRPTDVRVGTTLVEGDAATYLRLYAPRAPVASPCCGDVEVIRIGGPPSPWTDRIVLYHPDADVVEAWRDAYVRLPAPLAADVEAARALGSGDVAGRFVPWVVVAIALAFGAVLLAAAVFRRRHAVVEVGPAAA